ncbi:redoxin domain-containing protein [Streptomyces cocklensis]|jgi:methylamine dehydrogenase accessory protein MauD|uniref:Methylamine utilization protein MauD n=1 Tax=Actinacidiphila cocklensis TaxID=887465 RepID=A0A9W4DSG0_9ACTN|nr:redoxin domain-containing protein [Actinacidiphila cocklensis]MDD1064091.1 redoxin domain-containing protein [Actinacidiphila cocklensis]WSX75711.1 redoxin domain-containing protein [Streptomyces sp. NBC_00899]CAG6395231.1 Methylamine utilization protein MauD [Actinacidiphila cocklensis]
MNTLLLTAVAVLGAATALLFLMLLALAREIGRVQVRLGPLGARMMDTGPRVDQAGPSFRGLTDQLDRTVDIGGHRARPQLLVFTAPSCSTCKSLLPGIRSMARAEKELDVVLVSDGTPEEHREFLAGSGIGAELAYVDARDVGIAYQVGTTPYAVVLDEHGKIRGKGLCNHMAQVESLLNALETGTPSLQHLHAQAKAQADAAA